MRSVAMSVLAFVLLALAVAAGVVVAREIDRVEAHEAAILVLERNAAAMRRVLQRNGWVVEDVER